jgi:predicted ATPase/class 3 adenylate cyclase
MEAVEKHPMTTLPSGTITFLYTDIEGSTRRWEEHPAAMKAAVERHDLILHSAIESHGGCVFRTMGDAFCAAFPIARQALDAALDAQRALHAEPWLPEIASLKVRMALHTGIGEVRDGDYVGPALNRIARLLAAGFGGQTLLSRPVFDLIYDDLPEGVALNDLGEHRLRDLQRPEHVFQAQVDDLPSDFPPLKSLENQPNNLPVQSSLFVGRETEVDEVRGILRDGQGVSLLTLTGPGGVGKTRLALQVASGLRKEFADGVYLVSLAPLSDPNLLAPTIAQTLTIQETGGQPLMEALKGYLRGKAMLLVLDNFEQVVAAAPTLAELLGAAPRLKALATSREALRLRREYEYPVHPLDLPDRKLTGSTEQLARNDAVRLFVERARAVKPEFNLTDENASAVVEICHRLDGLPLAIELAAARVRLLPPRALLSRLEKRLPLLTASARDLPARQQTLRAAIEWSYDLLSEGEQKLFRRLAVFAGGCTLDAAEAVCNAGGDLGIDPLDGVESLIAKSLVRQEDAGEGEPRLLMLGTIMEYGLDRLDASAEGESVREQHARFFLELAERAAPYLNKPSQLEWLARLESERDNLRTALTWAIEHGEAERALRFVGALWFFWIVRGYLTEGRQLAEATVRLSGAQERTRLRANTLTGILVLTGFQNDLSRSFSTAEEAAGIFREVGDKLGLSIALSGTNRLTDQVEALALAKEAGDTWTLSMALLNLGIVYMAESDFPKARASLEEGLSVGRESGDRWILAQLLNSLGDLERIQGDFSQAEGHYRESLALHRELNTRSDIPSLLHNLGYAALGKGEHDRAEALLRESLQLQKELGNLYGVAECLAGLAGVAAAQGKPERASRLLGVVDAFLESKDVTMWPAEQVEYDRHLAATRALLDEKTFEQARVEGRAMPIERAITYALDGM